MPHNLVCKYITPGNHGKVDERVRSSHADLGGVHRRRVLLEEGWIRRWESFDAFDIRQFPWSLLNRRRSLSRFNLWRPVTTTTNVTLIRKQQKIITMVIRS